MRIRLHVPWEAPEEPIDMDAFLRSNTLVLPPIPSFYQDAQEARGPQTTTDNTTTPPSSRGEERLPSLSPSSLSPNVRENMPPPPFPTPVGTPLKDGYPAVLSTDAPDATQEEGEGKGEEGEGEGEEEEVEWSREMDRILWSFVAMGGLSDADGDVLDWDNIAAKIGGVSADDCIARADVLFQRRLARSQQSNASSTSNTTSSNTASSNTANAATASSTTTTTKTTPPPPTTTTATTVPTATTPSFTPPHSQSITPTTSTSDVSPSAARQADDWDDDTDEEEAEKELMDTLLKLSTDSIGAFVGTSHSTSSG